MSNPADFARMLRDHLVTPENVSQAVKTDTVGEIANVYREYEGSRLSAAIDGAVTTIPLEDVTDFDEGGGTAILRKHDGTYEKITWPAQVQTVRIDATWGYNDNNDDCYWSQSDASWDTAYHLNDADDYNNTDNWLIWARAYWDSGAGLYRCTRGWLRFDTSGLPDNAVVTAVRLKIRCSNSVDGGDYVYLVRTPIASVTGSTQYDLSNWTTDIIGMLPKGLPFGTWVTVPVQIAPNLSGYTCIGMRVWKDMYDITPTNGARTDWRSQNYGAPTPSSIPQLQVDYYIPEYLGSGVDEENSRLVGVTRGAAGTTATSHEVADEVRIYPEVADVLTDVWMSDNDDDACEGIPASAGFGTKLPMGARTRGTGEKVILRHIDAGTGGHNMRVVDFAACEFSYQAPTIVDESGRALVNNQGLQVNAVQQGGGFVPNSSTGVLNGTFNRRKNPAFEQVRSDSTGQFGGWFPSYWMRVNSPGSTRSYLGHVDHDGSAPGPNYHLCMMIDGTVGNQVVVATTELENGNGWGDPIYASDKGKYAVLSFNVMKAGGEWFEFQADFYLVRMDLAGAYDSEELMDSQVWLESDISSAGQLSENVRKTLSFFISEDLDFTNWTYAVQVRLRLQRRFRDPNFNQQPRTRIGIDDMQLEVQPTPAPTLFTRTGEPLQPVEWLPRQECMSVMPAADAEIGGTGTGAWQEVGRAMFYLRNIPFQARVTLLDKLGSATNAYFEFRLYDWGVPDGDVYTTTTNVLYTSGAYAQLAGSWYHRTWVVSIDPSIWVPGHYYVFAIYIKTTNGVTWSTYPAFNLEDGFWGGGAMAVVV